MKAKYLSTAATIVGSLIITFTHSAVAAPTRTLTGHVPAAVKSLQPEGALPATNHLRLAIALPLRNQAALADLLRQIYDPASPNYHHYLTPEQFAEQFGPAAQDYKAVIAFANANGLRITTTHPNRLLLDVDAPVADVERALHVKMRTYQHPTENRTFYAPDAEPALDLAVPILHISGLNNYSLPRPRFVASQQANGWNMAPNSGAGPGGGYMGGDFRAAYAPGVALNGAGQSVGLLQFDGYNSNDIAYYETHAGLPAVSLTNVLIDGASGLPSGSGGEVEVSLDIEMAISMAPGLSKVIVYEAANPSPFVDLLNRMATDNLAKQLSCSWYQPSGTMEPAADLIFQQMAAQGQSFFNASGDYDAFTGLIDFPGDTPYITQVGGTTLTTSGPGGAYTSETVWNRGNGIGSGGGISTQYPIPSWQTNVNMSGNQGSTTMRNVPDVALTAENVYVRADGVDQTVGGTSCAAPLWAGFAALINQQAATFGNPPVGFVNPAIYALGGGANYNSAFHDTTTGNNTSSSSPTKFYATTGYDLCTGWGTPWGQGMINALVPPLMVKLPASATEGDGLLAGAGQIQLPAAQASSTVVGLTSDDPAQLSVPASVTVPAGQTNAYFDLTILDDGVLDGTQTATVTASVPGIGTGRGSMLIFDKETTVLQVVLPATVIKGQGAVLGTVQASAPVGANVTVALSSSATNLIRVPPSVVISSGQTSAVFTATILTDGLINGGQTVNVTAHVQNWTDGVATVAVQDNKNLTVTLPGSVWENAGVQINAGSVRLAGTSAIATMVSLASSNPSKLIVPAIVTIPAGSLSNTFNLTPVDDSLAEGHQLVTVTASAIGFVNGSASMWVLDKETPPFPFNPRPGNFAVNVPANTNLNWSSSSNLNAAELILNGGFEAGSTANWTQVTSGYSGQFYLNDGTRKPYSPDPAMPPFAGSYSALGDENGPGIFYMYQTVTVPANATSVILSWAHRVRNFYSSFSSLQQFQVRICDTNNNVLTTPFTTNPGDPLLGDWVQESYDATSFTGKTVRVMFWVNPGGYYLDAHVDNVSLLAGSPGTNTLGPITNDVYFGTLEQLQGAPAGTVVTNMLFLGSTTNTSWMLPLLAPQTTYYWQIVAHRTGSSTGAVWQFTTAGVDHFAWNAIPTPRTVNQPFGVTLTAKDAFNTTVSNFTGPVALQCASGGSGALLEGFESGVWPHAPWVSASGGTFGTLSSAYAHDGNYGLSDPEWIYRTDVSIGNSGDSLSWWVQPGAGRAYLGFGASAGGCWSAVVEPNTTQFAIKQDIGYGFTDVVTANQTWLAGKWYKVVVQFSAGSTVTCKVYDSDGSTLLNSLTYSGVTGLPGGIAIRSFSGFALDTIVSGDLGQSLPFTPTNTGNFAGGVWSGAITVQQPATNVLLRADDGNQHKGTSNPFDVGLTNDLSLNLAASPSPVSIGANLTYTLTVANTGPADATGVTITNLLPANATFVSAVSSQGTCMQSSGVVTGNLGVVPGGANATVTIVVTPTLAGATLTNLATVSRAEADAYLGNNTATAITPVLPPAISIADASCLEGNVGTTNMIFTLTLAVPSAQTVTVNYATTNGTALAGKDYTSSTGLVTFAPGATNQSIAVPVIGNTTVEPDKTFFVNLSNPVNGSLGRAQATGTILNDDGLPGQVDHFVWNPVGSPQYVGQPFAATITALDYSNNVATNFTGTVNLSATSGQPSTFGVDFESGLQGFTINNAYGRSNGLWHVSTGRGSNAGHSPTHSLYYGQNEGPTGGGNYNTGTANGGVVTSSPITLATSGPVTLSFNYLMDVESLTNYDQAFVEVSTNNGVSYVVVASKGAGLTYYTSGLWVSNSVPLTQFAGQTILLRFRFDTIDSVANSTEGWYLDDIAIQGNMSVALTMTPTNTGAFNAGSWTGSVTVQQPATNAVLRADDGNGHNGSSNPFAVLLQNDLSISITDSPHPVSVGANLTYTLTAANTGPSDATGVMVTNILPANAAFVSAVSSQGTCTQSAGVVTGNLGVVSGGTNATVTIVVTPALAGVTLTNVATVARAEADAYPGNNTAVATTPVTTPAVSIADASCLEGNVGTTNMIFAVTLAAPSAQTITVNYATTNGTALAGSDYLATNGVLTFLPGVTNGSITVTVNGDTVVESNETVFVNLSNPVNGTLGRSQAVGTILNDDGLPGQVDHFVWNTIPSPQYVGQPFGATITAKDAFGTMVSNFNGTTTLSGFANGTGTNQAVRILSFTLYADTNAGGEYRNTIAAISNYFTGYVETTTTTTNAATLQAQLADRNVFLIVKQDFASAGVLGPLGTAWSSVLNNFVNRGGVVIVCSFTTEEHLILQNSGLLNLTRISALNSDTVTKGAAHYLNQGIAVPFTGYYINEYSTTNGVAVMQSVTNGAPCVIARDVGAGHVVMIGTDYFRLGTGMDRIVANAVRWAQTGGAGSPVAISPTNTGNFINGSWSGPVTVQQFATNVALHADDGNGHAGNSNPFDVLLTNDLSISIVDSPHPVSAGAALTYTLTVANTGPSDATGVTVTNFLPANATFVSAISSQGTCSQNGGMVIGNLGVIPGGTNATMIIVVTPILAGTTLTNTAMVVRAEADAYLGNNTAVATTPVTTPAVSIADASCLEGNVGTTNMIFAVTLAVPSAQTITVNYATTNGTALAGSDYLATNGVLTFPPGTTNRNIMVAVLGDILVETNETFFVNLSNPVNGTLGRSQAVGTILNDDGLPGQVDHFVWNTIPSPQYVGQPFAATITALDHSNNVATNFNGPVGLSGQGGSSAPGQQITFDDLTSSGVPVPAGYNGLTWSNFYYLAGSSIINSGYAAGTISPPNVAFNAGGYPAGIVSTGQINLVSAYLTAAWNDNLQVQVQGYAGATLLYNNTYTLSATAPTMINFNYLGVTMVNFNSYGGTLHPGYSGSGTHFAMDNVAIGSGVVIPVAVSPTNTGNFVNGVWTGPITVQTLTTNVVLRADDGSGHTGNSNPFNTVLGNDISISMTDSPHPVPFGANLTYTLAVTNTGPLDATGVTVTNVLPANAAFISAVSSQGTCAHAGGMVVGNLGTVPGGTKAIITIVVTPTLAGATLTNTATVSRAEADADLGNNTATVTTPVTAPAISIADAACLEGNVGTTNMIFTVTLAVPSAQTVTVNYATANGTATAGSDYIATNGVLTFPPGMTNGTISVAVIGDVLVETNETFLVNLSNPVNGTLARSQAVGTILDDDGQPGQLDHFGWSAIPSPQFVSQPFSVTVNALDSLNHPVTNFSGPVQLSALVPAALVVTDNFDRPDAPDLGTNWTIAAGSWTIQTNRAHSSATATSALAVFNLNSPLPTVTADVFYEGSPRTVYAALVAGYSNPAACVFVKFQDSTSAGNFNTVCFYYGNNGSPWPGMTGGSSNTNVAPFTAARLTLSITNGSVIVQIDRNFDGIPENVITRGGLPVASLGSGVGMGGYNNGVLDNFSSSGTGSLPIPASPTNSGNFVNGSWSGSIAVQQSVTNVVLRADDGNSHTGLSNPFIVVLSNTPPAVLVQPTNQTAMAGSTVAFSVVANGTPPLAYQWNFNGTNLPGATGATLTLTNVQINQAGNYAVVVTNFYGSATSSNAVLTVSSPPSCDPAPSGLAAWWPAEGNANDVIGTNNGTVVGSITYTNGEVGQAFSLNGSSGYVSVPLSPLLNSFTNCITLELWIKGKFLTTNPSWEWIATKGNSSWRIMGTIGARTVTFAASGTTGAGSVSGNQNVNDGQWHHVAGVYDGTNILLYVDGTLDVSTPATGLISQNSYPVEIGYNTEAPGGDIFNGLIDEVSLYHRALSASEIAAIYIAGSQGKCPTLVAPYFITQPTNLTVNVGGTATFSVTAGGTAPLFYQWNFNGTNIVGATNASLTLNNVQLNQAGAYAVQVANAAGSTNSAVATLTVNSPSCDPAPSGLVAWWPGEGNANDVIGTNNGMLVNGANFASGEVGQAFGFNGINQYINVPRSADLNSFSNQLTIEFWMYANPSNLMNMDQGLVTSDYYGLEINDGYGGNVGVNWFIDTTFGEYLISTANGGGIPVSPGQWHHIAGTYDGAKLQLYVDGAVAGNAQPASGTILPMLDASFVAIGSSDGRTYCACTGRYFWGKIDEVSIYRRTLSSSEIAAIYNAGAQGKCAPTQSPIITAQPTNQTVLAGGTATFSVAATGTPPLFYQWNFGGTNILGATNATLTLTNVQPNQAGNYAVLVANAYGSTNSVNALLTVGTAPAILTQPASCTNLVGTMATFNVTVNGSTPLAYQWRKNGTNIIGATATNLVIFNVQTNDGGIYSVTVTNAFGAVISSNAVLTVLAPPIIIVQPTNQIVAAGNTATFAVVAGGSPTLAYQWNFNGTNINGATGAILTLTNVQPAQAGNYAVQVTNSYGSVTSSNAVLTVITSSNNVPVITSFSPQSGAMGTMVHIVGLNFSSVPGSNTVYFGGVRAVVNTASTTNLHVTVPAGATYAPITETVGGLTACANGFFLPTFPSAGILTNTSLGSQITLPAGSSPGKVVIADLDGDGKPDLAVNNGGDHTIYVYRNISTNGTLVAGSFAPPVILHLGSGGEEWMVAADLDGDGKQDLLCLDYNSNVVMVLQNFSTPGNISFGPRVNFAVAAGPLGVAVQDLDGDGKPEIITANQNSSTISVLRNVSTNSLITTNSFAPAVTYAGGADTKSVMVADLDGDGKPDVVTVNETNSTSSAVSVFRNVSTVGNIAFASRIDFPGPIYSYKLAIGDMDGDGKLDVVFVSFATGQSVSVYRNTSAPGSIAFGPRTDFTLGGWGNSLALGDVDGDGKPDVAAVTQAANKLSLFRNISTPGTFTNSSLAGRLDFASGSNPFGVSIGDLDGDGRADIVFGNSYSSTISIYQNVINAKPFIVLQPASQTNTTGSTVTFTVAAGGSTPLTYQWKLNGTNIIGAIGATLTLTNLQLSLSGNYYSVLVTNNYGSVLSSNAALVVNALYHFAWNPIPSPRFVSTPFTVVVKALNPTNGIAGDFTSTVVFLSTNGVPVAPPVSGNFIQGVWTGKVTINQAFTNLVLGAVDSYGETGLANPITVVSLPPLITGSSGGTFYIAWPDDPSGFILETAPDLSPANWAPVSAQPFHFGGLYFQAIPMTETNAFYRLRFTGP